MPRLPRKLKVGALVQYVRPLRGAVYRSLGAKVDVIHGENVPLGATALVKSVPMGDYGGHYELLHIPEGYVTRWSAWKFDVAPHWRVIKEPDDAA